MFSHINVKKRKGGKGDESGSNGGLRNVPPTLSMGARSFRKIPVLTQIGGVAYLVNILTKREGDFRIKILLNAHVIEASRHNPFLIGEPTSYG